MATYNAFYIFTLCALLAMACALAEEKHVEDNRNSDSEEAFQDLVKSLLSGLPDEPESGENAKVDKDSLLSGNLISDLLMMIGDVSESFFDAVLQFSDDGIRPEGASNGTFPLSALVSQFEKLVFSDPIAPVSLFGGPYSLFESLEDGPLRSSEDVGDVVYGPSFRTEIDAAENSCIITIDLKSLPESSVLQVMVDVDSRVTIDYMSETRREGRASASLRGHSVSSAPPSASTEEGGPDSTEKVMTMKAIDLGDAVDNDKGLLSSMYTSSSFTLDSRCDAEGDGAKAAFSKAQDHLIVKFPLKGTAAGLSETPIAAEAVDPYNTVRDLPATSTGVKSEGVMIEAKPNTERRQRLVPFVSIEEI